MKIYVSEKENINLKFNKRCELVIFDSKPTIKLTEQELSQPIKTSTLLAYSLEQHDAEIRKPLEEEIVELKEHVRALKSSHDLSHQAYLFAKNEGLDLQNQARLKLIAELEEWVDGYDCGIYVGDAMVGYDTKQAKIINELKQKLREMKGESE